MRLNEQYDLQDLLALYQRLKLSRPPEEYELIYHYPPARTFSAVEPRSILSALEDAQLDNLLLYVHIPFATTRCTFCHYVCVPSAHPNLHRRYVESLTKEVEFYSGLTCMQKSAISAIHIGGGTPTSLSLTLLEQLLDSLAAHLPISQVQEISIEASPETIPDLAFLRSLKALGCTRLSIGVQSLNDSVLSLVNRAHSRSDALRAIGLAERADFRDLNVDLIYGLPGQTHECWLETLATITETAVDSVCAYQCRIAPNARSLVPGSSFTEEQLLALTMLTDARLSEAGFSPVQPNQWVRQDGSFHAYVAGKWRDFTPMLGLGASAYSSFPFATFVNTRHLPTYLATAESRIETAGWLDEERRLTQQLVLGWRALRRPIDFGALGERFPAQRTALADHCSTMERLAEHGLFRHDDNSCFSPTRLALHRADEISTLFYSARDRHELERSKAGKYGAYSTWPPIQSPAGTVQGGSEHDDQNLSQEMFRASLGNPSAGVVP